MANITYSPADGEAGKVKVSEAVSTYTAPDTAVVLVLMTTAGRDIAALGV